MAAAAQHDDLLERGEQTPLLQSQSANGAPLQDMPANSVKEKVVTGVAGAGCECCLILMCILVYCIRALLTLLLLLHSFRNTVVSSLLSLVLETSVVHPSVLISGALGLVLSPYAAFQQRKITQTQALKETNEVMEAEVAHLTAENVRLETSVQKVQQSVARLSQLEETLESVNQLQGESLQKLQEQLQTSRDILAGMSRNRKAVVLQNLVTVLLANDSDQDLLLSDEEVESLIAGLESIHGVQLKEQEIRNMIIEHGRSVVALMEVAKNVDNLFTFVE